MTWWFVDAGRHSFDTDVRFPGFFLSIIFNNHGTFSQLDTVPSNWKHYTSFSRHEIPMYVYKSVLSPGEACVKLSSLFSQLRNNVKEPWNLWVVHCLFWDRRLCERCCAVWYCGAVLSSAVLCGAVRTSVVQCGAVLWLWCSGLNFIQKIWGSVLQRFPDAGQDLFKKIIGVFYDHIRLAYTYNWYTPHIEKNTLFVLS